MNAAHLDITSHPHGSSTAHCTEHSTAQHSTAQHSTAHIFI
eukprot:CAMPEP_0115890830 /NCGR_PEP_ID=MMETSP0287-20121206/33551_1 /TAXON_ID=412157 /ORGANISM="Chrysochromulina rotalis, Strain UIO044" /LENGTH=40 /DNA_ID= /DNA_START= /DNA_END= /DNA_ORIENTATION=